MRKRAAKTSAVPQGNGMSETPDIFKYHDYRMYLKDWLASNRAGQSGVSRTSMKSLAQACGFTVGYFSMILSGSRKLPYKAVLPLAPVLRWTATERAYFEALLTMGNSDSQEERIDAYKKMRAVRGYRAQNLSETVTYEYLTHWYYVAIREMSALPEFQMDASWIQARLRFHVDLHAIEDALEFLKSHGFIEIARDGKVLPPERALDCQGGVHRLALAQFHSEMFGLAARSIDIVPSDERRVLGYTLVVDKLKAEKLQKALADLYDLAATLAQETSEKPEGEEEVMHIELALFPLTGQKKKGE